MLPRRPAGYLVDLAEAAFAQQVHEKVAAVQHIMGLEAAPLLIPHSLQPPVFNAKQLLWSPFSYLTSTVCQPQLEIYWCILMISWLLYSTKQRSLAVCQESCCYATCNAYVVGLDSMTKSKLTRLGCRQ